MSNSNHIAAAVDLLGVRPIDVYFPCETCGHAYEDHQLGEDGRLVGCLFHDGESFKCPCIEFAGLLADNKPRAVRMRMPSNAEWSGLVRGASLPVRPKDDTAPDQVTVDDALRNHHFNRAMVRVAVTHLRDVGDNFEEVWRPIRIVDTHDEVEDPTRQVTIEDFDRAGSYLITALVRALTTAFNEGGPFKGLVRGFRGRRVGDVRPGGGEVRLPDAPRADADGGGPAGSPAASGAPGG